MRLELTPTDLATILSALPGLPCERLEVAIEGERVIVTLCTVDYLRMVPNANAMVRMALSALPTDMPIWLQGTRLDGDAMQVTWGFNNSAFDLVKRFGAGRLVIEQVFASCPEAAQDRGEDSFRLVLRQLPPPVPALLGGWQLAEASLPADAAVAVRLVAHPG